VNQRCGVNSCVFYQKCKSVVRAVATSCGREASSTGGIYTETLAHVCETRARACLCVTVICECVKPYVKYRLHPLPLPRTRTRRGRRGAAAASGGVRTPLRAGRPRAQGGPARGTALRTAHRHFRLTFARDARPFFS
jgi:hypothetical protein